jgi:alpha-glucosidase
MTESYSSPDVIKKFYRDGSKLGAHLPFNFAMIEKIKKDSSAADIVSTISDWMAVIPDGHVTNWVVSAFEGEKRKVIANIKY